MPDLLPERQLCPMPDRIIVIGGGLYTSDYATQAVNVARSVMPKVTGQLAASLRPIYGVGWFGIYFPDRRVWFLEQGTSPFTMRSLAGKLIPMWVEDPSGAERKKNPKIKTRVTVDGRFQVLIFRRVGVKGSGRQAYGKARFPGAPGRIARREAASPLTTAGRTGGRIAKGNIGVAWRNPGIQARSFLNMAVTAVVQDEDIAEVDGVYLVDGPAFYSLLRI